LRSALIEDFGSRCIQTSLSKVDVRIATCRKDKDTKAILDELEQGVGFVACNTQVIGLLREALVAQARAALVRLPAAERGTSLLLRKLGWMLKRMGQLEDRRRGLWSRRRWPSCGQGVRLWAIATRTRWNRSATWAGC
jgi:hypothetical protein